MIIQKHIGIGEYLELKSQKKNEKINFYSPKDKDIFFWWAKRIRCIKKIENIDDKICLYLKGTRLNDKELDDLLALFYRYKIDMKQLAQFLTKENKEWFYDNPKAYWHRQVFGTKKAKKKP